MPALLDPTRNTFPVVLEADRDKIPEPTFFIRVLSMAEFDEQLAVMRDPKTADDVVGVLNSLLAGWEEMGSWSFQETNIEIMLTRPEIMELLALAFDGNLLSETERKKSESHRSCGAESCVNPAAEVVATS